MENMQTQEGPSTWASNPQPSCYEVTLLTAMSTFLKLDVIIIWCVTRCGSWTHFFLLSGRKKLLIFANPSGKGAELSTNYLGSKTLKAVTFPQVIFTEDQGVPSELRVGGAYFFFCRKWAFNLRNPTDIADFEVLAQMCDSADVWTNTVWDQNLKDRPFHLRTAASVTKWREAARGTSSSNTKVSCSSGPSLRGSQRSR